MAPVSLILVLLIIRRQQAAHLHPESPTLFANFLRREESRMDLGATAEEVDNDDDPVSQMSAHIPPHSSVCASDKDDDDSGAASETAPRPAKRQRR